MDENEFLLKPHRLLREVLRNFDSFKAVCEQSGEFSIEYRLGETVIFVGLTEVIAARNCILSGDGAVRLPENHRKALLLNVLKDMTQKDVGSRIGNVKPVIVGQYVELACEDLARHYFPDWYAVSETEGDA